MMKRWVKRNGQMWSRKVGRANSGWLPVARLSPCSLTATLLRCNVTRLDRESRALSEHMVKILGQTSECQRELGASPTTRQTRLNEPLVSYSFTLYTLSLARWCVLVISPVHRLKQMARRNGCTVHRPNVLRSVLRIQSRVHREPSRASLLTRSCISCHVWCPLSHHKSTMDREDSEDQRTTFGVICAQTITKYQDVYTYRRTQVDTIFYSVRTVYADLCSSIRDKDCATRWFIKHDNLAWWSEPDRTRRGSWFLSSLYYSSRLRNILHILLLLATTRARYTIFSDSQL